MMKLRNNKILWGILLLLVLCTSIFLFCPSEDSQEEKGMGDLILDPEVNFISDTASPEEHPSNEKPAKDDPKSSGSKTSISETDPNSSPNDSKPSESDQDSSSGNNKPSGSDQDFSSDDTRPSNPGEDKRPSGNTSPHPNELPLIPV